MSVLDTLKGRVRPKSALPGDLKRELAAAESLLAELESQHGAAALDAFAQEPGAERRLEDLNRQLADGRDRAANLRAAFRAAQDREQAAILAQRAALQKTQIAAARKHLEARDAAALALSAALEEAATQFHTLLDRSAKAHAACPIGIAWPPDSQCSQDDLLRLVKHELFRVSASPGNKDGRALPGWELPGMEFEYQPRAIPPLADRIKQASAYVTGKLAGKAPE